MQLDYLLRQHGSRFDLNHISLVSNPKIFFVRLPLESVFAHNFDICFTIMSRRQQIYDAFNDPYSDDEDVFEVDDNGNGGGEDDDNGSNESEDERERERRSKLKNKLPTY